MDSLKSLVLLWNHLADGLEIPSKDRAVFRKRAYSEGIPFLTKILPSLGKAFDRMLITGEDADFTQVRFALGKDGFPLFLGSLFRGYRNASSNEEAAANIKKVRQLTLTFYKLEVPYEKAIMDEAVEAFVRRDRALTCSLSEQERHKVRCIIRRVLCNQDPFDILPRHGSGAVANKVDNYNKWHEFRFIPKLDSIFPYDSHFFFNIHHVSEEMEKLLEAEVVQNPTSRLVGVPKDSRGPRLICCEPAEFQYIQQGLMRKLYDHLENPNTSQGEWTTKGYINFTDQSINQVLARHSSIDESLATLDLSEASDRVSWDLIQEVFPPRWVQAFAACRSTHVVLPDGTTYGPLRKFCAMGSACCFPVEGLVFWALLVSSLQTDVWVYGDDIIVPIDRVDAAISILEKAGLAVNSAKSCYRTGFRESCGGEYYRGYDVGYVKARLIADGSKSSWTHYISFAEQIAEQYGIKCGLNVLSAVEKLYNHIAPTSREYTAPGVFRHSEAPLARNDVFFKRRWSKDLQRFEHKILTERAPVRAYRASSRYHRCELLRKTLTQDKLGQVGSYTARFAKPRWVWQVLID